MDTDVTDEKKEIPNDKGKSKDVFQRKGKQLNLDCIYDNSSLGFEKPMSSRLKKTESQDPIE